MTEAWLNEDGRRELDTPAVVLDLDRVDGNIARMAAAMRDRGVALRPHAKTHKSLEVARRQLAAGAVGLTVATIGEAEVFAEGGIDDLFIAYPLLPVGPKVERLRRLADRCRLAVGADSVEGIEALASTFRGPSAPRVLIEIDAGGARSGVRPEDAGVMARRAADRGLDVVGDESPTGLKTRRAGIICAVARSGSLHAESSRNVPSHVPAMSRPDGAVASRSVGACALKLSSPSPLMHTAISVSITHRRVRMVTISKRKGWARGHAPSAQSSTDSRALQQNQALSCTDGYCFGSGECVELRENRRDVRLHGVLGDP
jgi:hypothetical protein